MTSYDDMPVFQSRRELVKYLDGHATVQGVSHFDQTGRRPSVKSRLLEVPAAESVDESNRWFTAAFSRRGRRLAQIDGDLSLLEIEGETFGYVERLTDRILVVHSTLPAEVFRRATDRLIRSTVRIDHAWFSGFALQGYWERVKETEDKNKYVTIGFRHEDRFSITADYEEGGYEPDSVDGQFTTVNLRNRIKELVPALSRLQQAYNPLHAISRLQFPHSVGKGGHDLYSDGYVADRSDSFAHFRATIVKIAESYNATLEMIESSLWGEVKPGRLLAPTRAVLSLSFPNSLPELSLRDFVMRDLSRQNNVFRLYGQTVETHQNHYRFTGIDTYVGSSVQIGFSPERWEFFLPRGTCGNSVLRFVTNVQRMVDPGVKVSVGGRSFGDLVSEIALNIPRANVATNSARAAEPAS